MYRKLPLIAFIIFSLIDFFGIYLEKQWMIYLAKPMLMTTLFGYYYLNKKSDNLFFVLGLLFSLFGDLFLLGSGELYFILGLIFFLIAHVFYIIMVFKILLEIKLKDFMIAGIPYLLLFLILINVLYDGLGSMKIPVIIYAMTISFLGVVSLLLFLQSRTKTSLLLLFGVLIFITSDTILALNLFYEKQSFYPILIMTTYVMAQFLICKFVLNLNK
ncbi:MAG: lysoplasmalogenase [Flavobacteriaceae bacterium]|nr:lysoplasmalogenase [Flavobacteriaceae bacterium]